MTIEKYDPRPMETDAPAGDMQEGMGLMEKVTLGKGQVLHRRGERVQQVEMVLSGALVMTDGDEVEVRLGAGTVAGAIYLPKEGYAFDYVALEDTTLMTFPYLVAEDLAEAVLSVPNLAPALAEESMALTKRMLEALSATEDAATELGKEIKYNYNDYQFLCVKLQMAPTQFAFVERLPMFEPSRVGFGWEADVCRAFAERAAELKETLYALDVRFCVDAFMRASTTGRRVGKEIEAATDFIGRTRAASEAFMTSFYDVKSKVDAMARGASDDVPAITDALDVILAFSSVKMEVADAFRRDLKQFMDMEDRRAKSDEMRHLRRSIADGFYQVYEAAFFKSMETAHVPAEVRMFFLFGFADEGLAGEANTAALYRAAVGWEADPAGRILSLYDWLVKIYQGVAMPSKNEFDNDWVDYLREEVRTASITQQRADELMTDRRAMVRFEIQNMFKSANRITNGRMAAFVPVFTAQDVIRPLDKCLADPARVEAALTKVTDIDFGCFYRPVLTEFPELKISRFIYNTEVRPYVILMPNVGNRGLMWQEIEGVKRTTPAHMVLSVFHSEELDETITRMCAQFRWEMCRRLQGVRYTDISELSLTSEYVKYLQFYKKNGNLSSEMKERVKLALQKARNDYKSVFVAEYERYIQNEAFGLPRLNKVAREILFRYCTLSKKFRKSLASNPQFQPLMEHWGVTQSAKVHALDLLIRKVQRLKPGEALPKEIAEEAEFLRS